MAFCVARSVYAAGWVNDGNRQSFEALAHTDPVPLGVLAYAEQRARSAGPPAALDLATPWRPVREAA